uniref:beta-ketoacyl synthase chain length factor n=1 Tax=Cellvibrio fontiphilus TaxID=1815559 RepID=UPI002B4BF808|nr:beta-ketoacyl synthase chain length factor [Cellvibrio fontiphilus]
MSQQKMTVDLVGADLVGIGAWGPAFNNWPELQALFANPSIGEDLQWATQVPKPEIIPSNERRRAPLPVRAAVDVSWQALQQAGLASSDVACVFGSGLGDTEITDYMCRVLTTAEKQLSPTKFHNSVHNAAAGYWTISTGCMKSANSIAAYQNTAGLALLEAIIQCQQHSEPVLVTLFDTAAHDAYRQIFACEHSFAVALLLVPAGSASSPIARLTLGDENTAAVVEPQLPSTQLAALYRDNPSAKVLGLLQQLATKQAGQASFALSPARVLNLEVSF